MQNYTFSGHMTVMALMEAPAIIVGLILIHYSVKMMFTAPK
jgi:hypothetical protein